MKHSGESNDAIRTILDFVSGFMWTDMKREEVLDVVLDFKNTHGVDALYDMAGFLCYAQRSGISAVRVRSLLGADLHVQNEEEKVLKTLGYKNFYLNPAEVEEVFIDIDIEDLMKELQIN